MIALAVAAILAGAAIPAVSAVMRETRLTAATNDLFFALFLTRSEAIKRGKRVSICTSDNGDSCSGDVGWHVGWLVFEDGNANGIRDHGEALLRVSTGTVASARLRITGTAWVRDSVSYTPFGATRTVKGALQMGSITVCEEGRGRKIVINRAGRPRVERLPSC